MKVTLYPHAYDREADGTFKQLPEPYGRVVLATPKHDTDVLDGETAPRIFINLDNDVMEGASRQTVCTATVKFPDNKSAVVHFCVQVRDSKVTAFVTAGGPTRDVIRDVRVPVWERKHVAGKPKSVG